MARYFVRCVDCLTVAAIESDTAPRVEYSRLAEVRCGACESSEPTIEVMGRVERDRLVRDELRCACDSRCTGARGPLCSCGCGGKNHGNSLLAAIRVTVDRGAVPVLGARSTVKARVEADEYRRGIAAVRAVIEALLAKRDAAVRGWLERADFEALHRAQKASRTATSGRVHASRMKALAPYITASPEESRAILQALYARTSAAAPAIADVPFSLTAPVRTGGGKQDTLF